MKDMGKKDKMGPGMMPASKMMMGGKGAASERSAKRNSKRPKGRSSSR